jgi:hypothetical protein
MDSHSQETKLKTFGEKLVGLSFNPSNNEKVDRAKKLFAEAADLLKEHILEVREKEGLTTMGADLFSHALGEILNAQMCTVKVLTFVED